MHLEMWSSPRFATQMERSGEFLITFQFIGFPQLSPFWLAAAPIPAQLFLGACRLLFSLLTDISSSHPAPFKYVVKPRSEKIAALVASVEL